MEDFCFRKAPKNLVIGDFGISCLKKNTDIKLEIPFSGMAFYQPNDYIVDFQFLIDEVEIDESGKLLFGSEDFSTPVFLHQRENGEYDWTIWNEKRTDSFVSYF